MTTITLELPDELSEQLEQHKHQLTELLARSLRQPLLATEVYRYILDFIANRPTPEQISAFGPTPEMIERCRTLVAKERVNEITPAEKAELDEYDRIEHLMAMIKTQNLPFSKRKGLEDEKLEDARRLFRQLYLEDWRETASSLKQGGQAAVLVVEDKNGGKGVFRYLKDHDPKSIKRFHRELKILTDPKFQSPYLVKLLAYTTDDEPWYISELGKSFPDYWDNQRIRAKEKPERLVEDAIRHLAQLLEGLAPLHEAGVVHRDIKPRNFVIADNSDGALRAVLIDFGVAHVEDEARVTTIDDAVGNIRFSPDQMMNRMDKVPPWLDVYEFAQVLIWMVSQRPTKQHWNRPLDWRWVKYDNRFPDNLVVGIRAITALCSQESVSPKNAGDLLRLIQEIFPQFFTNQKPSLPTFDINLTQIQSGIGRGKAAQHLKAVEDIQAIDSCFPAMDVVYRELREDVERLYQELNDGGLAVRKLADRDLSELRNQASSPNPGIEITLYELEFGEGNPQVFKVRLHGIAYLPSVRVRMGGPLPSESSNLFVIALQCYANLPRSDVGFPHHTKVLTLESNGTLLLRDEHMTTSSQTTIPEMIQLLAKWISDEKAWEVINSV